ncbi:MAG: hypothetical protein KKF16_10370 [Euryarchaeota archaeon]|nr:hypothetical protein [Euryarchaeota archaeon]MBU4608281.1 hypothetical protein [Euryarchaeota archaeon]MBV1730330.1 hypothetical protein [Methanobacterium sp.]MBV1756127.1 hypothetical protein [Methanobacterium sp.]
MNKKDSPIIINLIEKGLASTSISQLSKDIEIDYKTVYEIVKRLEKV